MCNKIAGKRTLAAVIQPQQDCLFGSSVGVLIMQTSVGNDANELKQQKMVGKMVCNLVTMPS